MRDDTWESDMWWDAIQSLYTEGDDYDDMDDW